MLFISVLLSLPCWAVSFLSPETMAYSLESPVPRMSQGRPRGCWLGPRLCSSCCAYGFTRGIFLPFILFWWERKVSFFFFFLSSVQFSRSVVSDSLQPHESRTPAFPVHHQLPEFTQTHVH